jgi:hypothetical protein
MKNWKTTLTGVLTLVVTIAGAGLHYLHTGTLPDLTAIIAGITAGGGLIFASDSK